MAPIIKSIASVQADDAAIQAGLTPQEDTLPDVTEPADDAEPADLPAEPDEGTNEATGPADNGDTAVVPPDGNDGSQPDTTEPPAGSTAGDGAAAGAPAVAAPPVAAAPSAEAPAAEGDTGITPMALSDYHPDDVAAINSLIENNGLPWALNDPDSWPVSLGDGVIGVRWYRSDPRLPYRATRLVLSKQLPATAPSHTVDLRQMTALQYLRIAENHLTDLNVSGLRGLQYLYCDINNLTELKISGCDNLASLYFSGNQVSGAFDASPYPKLYQLNTENNNLTSVNTTQNPALQYLHISNNKLEYIDISGNPILVTINCIQNPDIKYLKEQNGNTLFINALGDGRALFMSYTISRDFETEQLRRTFSLSAQDGPTEQFNHWRSSPNIVPPGFPNTNRNIFFENNTGGDATVTAVFRISRALETIDLSETIVSGHGYTISGTTEPYSTGGYSGGAVPSPNRTLAFGNDATSWTYEIVQSGLRVPANAGEPKHGTAIFNSITIASGVEVTLIVDDIDLIGNIVLEGSAKVTIFVANANFVHGSISLPANGNLSIDGDVGAAGEILTVAATSAQMPAIGGNQAYTVTIEGATVIATGGSSAAGIGGGMANSSGGSVHLNGGTIVATGGDGAGIGGGAGGASPSVNLAAAADVKAYSRDPQGKPAIDSNMANNGNGFFVNAAIDQPLSASSATGIFVYADGNRADRANSLSLPGGYRCFAYSTGAAAAQNDNIYANLAAADIRVIDRVSDSSKVVYSVNAPGGYSAHGGINGALPVKLRALPLTGQPSAENIQKTSADLVNTGHSISIGDYVSGGFRYSSSLGSDGNPASPTSLPWTIPAFTTNPITVPTGDVLVPNTKYHLQSNLTVDADLWLTPPSGQHNFLSSVQEFVTKPSITAATAEPGDTADKALISADFEGGNEALTVKIYWGTATIDPNNPASWTSLASATLAATDFDSTGFDRFAVSGLAAGGNYNFMVVASNVTGYDARLITFDTTIGFTFTKVNESDAPLAGVVFELYSCTTPGAGHTHTQLAGAAGCWGNPVEATSGSDGKVEFVNLVPGDYMLAEIETVDGYQLPQGQWLVSIDNTFNFNITARGFNSNTNPPAFKTVSGELLLPNYRQTVLPRSGGGGTLFFTAIGIILLGSAVMLVTVTGSPYLAKAKPAKAKSAKARTAEFRKRRIASHI